MSKGFPIVNNTGFEKVFYQHLRLPNRQIEKGMKIVQDERVFNVIENKISDEETEIYGFFLKGLSSALCQSTHSLELTMKEKSLQAV